MLHVEVGTIAIGAVEDTASRAVQFVFHNGLTRVAYPTDLAHLLKIVPRHALRASRVPAVRWVVERGRARARTAADVEGART